MQPAALGQFIALAAAAVLPAWWLYNWALCRLSSIPGPAGVPLLGNLISLQQHGWHTLHLKCMLKYGNVFRLWHGSQPHITVAGPEGVNQMLSRCPLRFMFPSPMGGEVRQLYLDGLLFSQDMAHHKRLKAVWQPAFHPTSLTQYLPLMEQCARKLTAVCILAADTKQYVDIFKFISSMTLEVVGTCGFGITLDSLSSHMEQLGGPCRSQPASSTEVSDASAKRVLNAIAAVLDASRPEKASVWVPIYLMFPSPLTIWLANVGVNPKAAGKQVFPDRVQKQVVQNTLVLKQCALTLIAQQRELDAQQQAADETGHATVAGQKSHVGLLPGTFLHHMLSTCSKQGPAVETDKQDGQLTLTDDEIAGNVVTFLAAGYETTASALTYAIHHLSLPENEAALQLAQQEVDAFTDEHGKDAAPNFEQLSTGFPVLEACFYETLRLTTPAPYVFRQAQEDMMLAGCPHVKLKQGTKMQVSIYALHRHPQVWPEAERFLPTRFLPEGQHLAAKAQGAYVPFGGGQRLCVGHKFATMEAKLVLIHLLRRFTFQLEPGFMLKTVTGVTMAPDQGVRARILHRYHDS